MKIALGAVAVVLLLYIAFEGIRFAHTLSVSKKLIAAAHPFEKDASGNGPSILVIGDSTAVGVGASKPEDSVAGRLSNAVDASHVENYAVSGAQVKDLPPQIQQAKRSSYDIVLVQVGANDITHLHMPTKTAYDLEEELSQLPDSKQVIVLTAGNVGQSTAIPFVLRPLFADLTFAYHAAFSTILSSHAYTYVNIAEAPGYELFGERPDIYLAADGFHPSSAGYELWFNAVQHSLKK